MNQTEQDQPGERHDIVLKRRRGDLQAFDRRQHRDRRRDQRVAIEERGADDAEQDDGKALAADRAIGKGHQRKRPAFAVIVGAEQDQHVFDRDDQNQRPDDERQNAEDHRLERSLTASLRGMQVGSCRCRHRRRRCSRASAPKNCGAALPQGWSRWQR